VRLLDDCLARYTTPEPLEGYKCDGCEEVGTTTRVRHAPVPPSTPSVPKVLESLLNKHFLKHLETHSLLPLRLAYSP
jgi:hypothetical protein